MTATGFLKSMSHLLARRSRNGCHPVPTKKSVFIESVELAERRVWVKGNFRTCGSPKLDRIVV